MLFSLFLLCLRFSTLLPRSNGGLRNDLWTFLLFNCTLCSCFFLWIIIDFLLASRGTLSTSKLFSSSTLFSSSSISCTFSSWNPSFRVWVYIRIICLRKPFLMLTLLLFLGSFIIFIWTFCLKIVEFKNIIFSKIYKVILW